MTYQVQRIQVEEGFLDGLDVHLLPGLNVLIGGRGTGKTSLIELLRYCLGAPAFTTDARERAHQHAISVLQGGKVTVTLSDGEDMVVVTRAAADSTPRSAGPVPRLTVLAQTEIEAVGAKEEGRLHLIDRCRSDAEVTISEAASVIAELRAQTAEISAVISQLAVTEDQLKSLEGVPAALAEATSKQEELMTTIAANEEDRKQLEQLQVANVTLVVRADLYERVRGSLLASRDQLRAFGTSQLRIEEWPEQAGPDDLLSPVRDATSSAVSKLSEVLKDLDAAIESTSNLTAENEEERTKVDEASRILRQKLSSLQEGAGAITRTVNDLREKEGQLKALIDVRDSHRERLVTLIDSRRVTYEHLDELRDRRFQSRKAIADSISEKLTPQVRVSVTRAARKQNLVQAIASQLRGSGLHRSTLAPLLAAKLAPIELIEAVEKSEAGLIAEAAEIPLDRAAAVVDQLRRGDTSSIVSAAIEDRVDLFLLDGAKYKPQNEMSIGQRCTTVLPILLAEGADVLVVDQPEDHLDNAYITATLVEALRERTPNQQVLFSSHNANIPVLGEAARVILMESDGKRGFATHSGGLDNPETVDAVTSVMEGGIEAFRARAEFYGVTS